VSDAARRLTSKAALPMTTETQLQRNEPSRRFFAGSVLHGIRLCTKGLNPMDARLAWLFEVVARAA
jgi:hypothetical protein